MRLSPRRAESLVESIIAVTVISLATTAALSLIRTSISGNRVIAEKVIAMNLALEGIEAVRNVRDTNYLNFSSAADDCWDAIDAEALTDCDPSGSNTATRMDDSIGTTYYLSREVLNEEYRFSWEITTDTDDENISLYTVTDSTGTAVGKLYAQSGLETEDSTHFTLIEEDTYTRSLVFATNSHNSDAVDVTVTVGWTSKGQDYTVDLTRTISNVY